jgi:hypothetical protein
MDHIDQHLATAAIDNKYNPAIRAALAIGKKTLNRYYDRTDHSEVYRIAMSIFNLQPFNFFPQYEALYSFASLTQTGVFQKGWLGGLLDQGSRRDSLGRVRPLIPLL